MWNTMTVGHALAEADSLWPNAYSDQTKIKWLSRCESTIYNEIIRYYFPKPKPFCGFGDNDTEKMLIAPEPYDQLYIYWLEAMIHYADGEIPKYNNAIAQYQAMMQAFKKWYAKHKLPGFGGRFRF